MPAGANDLDPLAVVRRVGDSLSVLGVEPATTPRILACLSGGADSSFLTHALKSLGCEVKAFHLDHMLRPESENEAEKVVEIATGIGVELIVRRRQPDVEPGSSPETAARELRYELAEEVADEVGADWIATGHTADDQIETFFINLARGAGLDGLAGIPPVRGRVIRPLLEVSRDETRDCCAALAIDFVEDPSNQERTILRNRIRHDLIPRLAEVLGGAFRESMLRQFGYLRGDAELINSLADAALADSHHIAGGAAIAIGRESLGGRPVALARRMIRRALVQIGVETPPAGRFVEEALGVAAGGGACDLGGGAMARLEGDWLVIRPAILQAPESSLGKLPGRIECPGFGVVVTGEICPTPETWEASPDTAWLDDAAAGQYVVRVAQAGERVAPVGLKGSKPVADVLSEAGMGRTERETAPVLARADQELGQIVWPIGHRIDRSVAVSLGAAQALRVRATPLDSHTP